jgi:dipeptidyl aminopeptidase/acylaminoacyl peptidase
MDEISMKRIPSFLLLVTIFLLNPTLKANDWDNLFDHSKYQNAKISPSGDYIAVAMDHEEKTMLIFLKREDMSITGSLKLGNGYEVGDYHWVNNERVVMNMVKRVAWLEQPQSYGELYAVDFDGSHTKLIYGYQAGEIQLGSRVKKKKSIYGWANIIDVLPEDEQHILIESTPMSKTGERLSSVLLLNVYSGITKKGYGGSPIPFSHFLTDTDGKIKAVVGRDRNNIKQLYLKDNGKWNKVPDGTVGPSVSLISISTSGEYLYTRDNFNQDLYGIFKLNIEDFTYSNVYTDKNVDITYAELTTDGRSAFAIRVDEDYPAYLILDKKVQEAKVFKDLLKSFPYSSVNITSRSNDGKFYIIKVSSDTDPGSLYLFNKAKNKLKILFKFKPEVKNEELLQSEPIQVKASDGNIINGYFTQARNTDKNTLAPVVVLVHGGPHGIRDYWGYNRNVQYLALNGYSVLQVNYRGSGGYGEKFELDGYKVWGSKIQQDIHQSYQWLVREKKAEANNVCIMGASFGAYSAVQSATIYPNTYKCVIANAGVYDLELILEENNSKAVKSFWVDALGEDLEKIRNFSPVHYAERIQVPLLLAHGEDDKIAPIEHVERLRESLDKEKKPYEWYAVNKEGHGFYNPKNQKAYMRKVLSFLNKHLKQGKS